MPFILTGVRLAVARALVGAIVVEFFLSSNGLGYFVQNETSNFQMSAAMAGNRRHGRRGAPADAADRRGREARHLLVAGLAPAAAPE